MSSEAKVVGYCRTCGKALDETTVHSAQGTIFCEEHAPASPAGPPTPPPIDPSPYTASPYSGGAPPPIPNRDVSPGLAFGLGFIPGVGAIYNGQYAKGLVHVIIFGLIISILSNGAANGFEPVLSLLIPGFIFYMAFEAFHTAKRRQAGEPVDEFSSLIPLHGGASRVPMAPLMLILLGTIFLLNNLEIFELRRVLRFWPVLLIALGAYMLYLRMSSARSRGGER
jgi:LiaI-LiaF-like transmembrane region